MQVAKWGNSLAVRLPSVVVEALNLKEGDDIEIEVAGSRRFEIKKAPGAQELLARLRKYRGDYPAILNLTQRPMSGVKTFFDANVLLYLLRTRPKRIGSKNCS